MNSELDSESQQIDFLEVQGMIQLSDSLVTQNAEFPSWSHTAHERHESKKT